MLISDLEREFLFDQELIEDIVIDDPIEVEPIEDSGQTVYVGLTYDDLVTFYKDYLSYDLEKSEEVVALVEEPEQNIFLQELSSLSSTDTLLLICTVLLLAQFIRNFMGGIFS